MDKNFLNSINITLDVYSICICVVIIISLLYKRKKRIDESAKWFVITCGVTVLFTIVDIFTWISEGTDASWKLVALPCSDFLYYFLALMLYLSYVKYIKSYYSKFTRLSKIYDFVEIGVVVSYLIIICLTPVYNILYEITPDNVYVRGKYFWISILVNIIFHAEVLLIVICNRRFVPGHQTIAFCSFIFIPLILWSVQIIYYGISLTNVGITFSFFIIFLNLNLRLEENLDRTNDELRQKNQTIINMQDNTILSLSNLVENRDTDTGHHVRRTRDYVTLIAKQCKKDKIYTTEIDDIFINLLAKSAPLHDIGKIIVPDYVLKKPGKLTPEEFDLMKNHAAEGGRIISEVLGIGIDPEYLRVATEISTGHHERWDGTGYPKMLAAEKIPLSARIMAIADVFDALVSKRCYKESMPIESAFEIIKKESGSHFDPVLVNEFLEIKYEIIKIVERFSD